MKTIGQVVSEADVTTPFGRLVIHEYKDQRWVDPWWYSLPQAGVTLRLTNGNIQQIKQQQSNEYPRQDDRNKIIQEDSKRNR